MSSALIKMEQRRIQRLIDLAEDAENSEAVGTLDLCRRRNSIYCYENLRRNGQRLKRSYLGKADSDAVRAHCEKKYRRELLARLRANKGLLESMSCNYQSLDPAAILSVLPSSYSRIASKMFIDRRYEELKKWASADYEVNLIAFPKAINRARDGRRVRSKGEEISYNMLLDRGIPFRYDSIMSITGEQGDTKKVSPDFLIQCYDGSFMIIEHLGIMGNLSYAYEFGRKCYWYFQEDYVLGRNLFLTSDDPDGGTDSECISKVIDQVERVFWGY